MAMAAVVVAIALLIGSAVEADAASTPSQVDGLPSPMLLLPVMLAFALRVRD